jgi:phosphatidylinositol glycan class B
MNLNPALFAAVYQLAAKLATLRAPSLPAEAALFIAAPKIAQAVSAALLDCYTSMSISTPLSDTSAPRV